MNGPILGKILRKRITLSGSTLKTRSKEVRLKFCHSWLNIYVMFVTANQALLHSSETIVELIKQTTYSGKSNQYPLQLFNIRQSCNKM